jgi:hypothetical protein
MNYQPLKQSIMTRLTIILFLLLIFWLDCKAQYNIGLYYYPTLDHFYDELSVHNNSFGIKSDIKLNHKFSIKTGIGYEYQKYNPWWGVDYALYPSTGFYITKLIKFDGYIAYNLTQPNKMVAFYLFTGHNVNYSFYEEIACCKNKKIKWHNIITAFGFGCSYKIKKITINMDPTFEVQLLRNFNNLARDYPIYIGMRFGVAYDIKKKND